MTIGFFGIKNDTHWDRLNVNIPLHTNPKLDPVITLRKNIEKTAQWRAAVSNAVFLMLKSPHEAIESTTVSEIVQQAIRLAGLANNIDPKIVQKLGRWKTKSVFF